MKQAVSLTLTILIFFTSITVNSGENMIYELWAEAPYVTSGITQQELNIHRAKSIGELELFRLSRLGSNYYFAICEDKTNYGGYNGNIKTSWLTVYILLVNGGDFIVLSSQSFSDEYFWDRSIRISNLASTVTNTAWYNSKNSEIPYYVIQPDGLYTHTYYTKYLEQIIITSTGRMYKFSTESERSCHEFPTAFNNILYMRVDRFYNGSSYNYYYTEDGARAARMTPYIFRNGIVSYDTASRIQPALSEITTANGYTVYVDNFQSNVYTTSSNFLTTKSSIFPDGRRVEAYWLGKGNNMYEVWIRIYNANGTLRTNNPTGYTAVFGSASGAFGIVPVAINNSKFYLYDNRIGGTFLKEYYRVAVVEENISGEIQTGGSIGSKNISPPENTDTEPVQNIIDFAEKDLPLGFNIRENVIDSAKLNSSLRQQVNTIRLNDIVIIKREGYISGVQNTGVVLNSYSDYDYGFGSGDYIRFYSNGQNFLWYCYYPETLATGLYNKTFYWGDKMIYVTVKVIAPPNNSGVTSVTF